MVLLCINNGTAVHHNGTVRVSNGTAVRH
jgi:hypothetical protein